MATQRGSGNSDDRSENPSTEKKATGEEAAHSTEEKGQEQSFIDAMLTGGRKPEGNSEEEDGSEDFASLLASLQDQEGETSPSVEAEEASEDTELSRMISLMSSQDPGHSVAGESDSDKEPALDALPEGTEVVFDEEATAEEPPHAETETESGPPSLDSELASVAGDFGMETVPSEDGGNGWQSLLEEEDTAADAIEGYDVTDTADALLSTIGLDNGRDSDVPSPAEDGIQDDGTPVSELVDDRILDDLVRLHENLNPPETPRTEATAAFAPAGPLSETHGRILVIDDDPDNRSLFKGILESEEYSFTDVESAEEALEVLREGESDLILLNLDIRSQDGFELIEEAASDVALSQVPILVNSVSTDDIEKAIRLGASDYFIRPMSVIDVKFQIPIKVKNHLKIRRAERMLAVSGDAHEGDLVSVPVLDTDASGGRPNGLKASDPLPETPIQLLDRQRSRKPSEEAEDEARQTGTDLAPSPEDQPGSEILSRSEPATVEAGDDLDALLATEKDEKDEDALADILGEAEEEKESAASSDAHAGDDLDALLATDEDEKDEDALTDLLGESEEKGSTASSGADAGDDLDALLATDEDEKDEDALADLLGESEEEEPAASSGADAGDDLDALLATDEDEKDEDALADLLGESEEKGSTASSGADAGDDLDALLATDETEEEDSTLDDLFDEETSEEPSDAPEPKGSSDSDEKTGSRDEDTEAADNRIGGGLALAGAALAVAGASGVRGKEAKEETPKSASEMLGQPLRRTPAPIWRSPNLARAERERISRERRIEMPQRSGRRRILYAILALALIGVAGYGLWAKQRLRETGEVASILPEAIKPVAPAESGTESSPTRALTESSPTSEAQPPSAAAQREEESYERARSRISVPSGEDRELTEAKVHIRAAVDHLESTGGQWWAPWQVLKTSGESIKELVNERSRREILEIFSVSEQRAELGLQRKSVVDFLARHGYKIRGKQASDLTARELFEVLSMREIRTKEKVVSILTALKEKAAASRAGRAARIRSIGNAQLAIREKSVTFDVSWRSCAFREWPVSAESHPHGRYADDDGYRARSLT